MVCGNAVCAKAQHEVKLAWWLLPNITFHSDKDIASFPREKSDKDKGLPN